MMSMMNIIDNNSPAPLKSGFESDVGYMGLFLVLLSVLFAVSLFMGDKSRLRHLDDQIEQASSRLSTCANKVDMHVDLLRRDQTRMADYFLAMDNLRADHEKLKEEIKTKVGEMRVRSHPNARQELTRLQKDTAKDQEILAQTVKWFQNNHQERHGHSAAPLPAQISRGTSPVRRARSNMATQTTSLASLLTSSTATQTRRTPTPTSKDRCVPLRSDPEDAARYRALLAIRKFRFVLDGRHPAVELDREEGVSLDTAAKEWLNILHEEIEDFNKGIAQRLDIMTTQKQVVAKYRQDLEDSSAQKDSLMQQVMRLTKASDEAAAELKTSSADAKVEFKEKASLEQQIATLEETTEGLLKDLLSREAVQNSLEAQISRLEKQLRAQVTASAQQNDANAKRIAELERQLEAHDSSRKEEQPPMSSPSQTVETKSVATEEPKQDVVVPDSASTPVTSPHCISLSKGNSQGDVAESWAAHGGKVVSGYSSTTPMPKASQEKHSLLAGSRFASEKSGSLSSTSPLRPAAPVSPLVVSHTQPETGPSWAGNGMKMVEGYGDPALKPNRMGGLTGKSMWATESKSTTSQRQSHQRPSLTTPSKALSGDNLRTSPLELGEVGMLNGLRVQMAEPKAKINNDVKIPELIETPRTHEEEEQNAQVHLLRTIEKLEKSGGGMKTSRWAK